LDAALNKGLTEGSPPRASILLVDDRRANLVALEATLSPLGHRLVTAASGRDALKALLNEEFALILLDVQMPGLDGFETAALIKQHPRTAHIPIIFITAIHRDPPQVFKGYAQGGADYLLKPFDPTILRAKVGVFVDLFLKEKTLEARAASLLEREREDLARKSERRVQRLVDSMPLCLWALRSDGKLYYCNRAWTDFSNLSTEQSAQMDPASVCHPDDLARVRQAWESAFAHGAPLEVQCRLRRANDGIFRWHLGRVVPERDDAGAVTGWIVTAADIESQKKAEEEYARIVVRERHAREDAEAANRAKDEFLATLSHELRTPLNAMVGWTRMLRTGSLTPEKSQKALETIERNAKAQADLIEDILDVSRIITGKLRIEVQPTDLDSVARAAVDSVRPAAEAKGIELDTQVVDCPPSFAADPARLQQVMWNLLSNAIKFTPAGGRVQLIVDQIGSQPGPLGQPGSAVRITVKDNGRGISADFAPYVFDRFRQVDSTSKRAHGGLGLGLAIVRHLVELHGGTIEVESPGEGQGASFTVSLPVIRADEPQVKSKTPVWPRAASLDTPAEPTSPEVVDLAGVKVLLVDDEPDARELLSEVLEQYGATVIVAASAEEALRAMTAERPTVLLSDIGLPGEDGYSLIRRVRALPALEGATIPAAALTAYARSEDGRRALAAGFGRHAVKPIQPAALAVLVRELADAGKAAGASSAPVSPTAEFGAWPGTDAPPVRS
jgi:PAS domain S-box-containing protein